MNLRQRNNSGAPQSRCYLALLAVLLILLLAACGGEASPTPTSAAISVETGGMALPDAAGEAAAPDTAAAAAAAVAAVAEAAALPVLALGAEILTSEPALLSAEPDPASLHLAEYPAGSRLTVIEPDGDHAEYPVVVDGHRWYRVRAEDGLVGWVDAWGRSQATGK